MKAYFIGQIDVHDLETYKRYLAQVSATVEQFGGRYLVRAGPLTLLEGKWSQPRTVVIEFPSREKTESWYNSPVYQSILPLRLAASTGNAIIVDGV